MGPTIVFLTRFLTRAFIVYCWVLAICYAMHATTLSNVIAHQYRGDSNQAKVVILLHELGHATNAPGFVPDYGSPSKVDHNDSLITNGCKNVVKSAGKFKGAL